MHTETSNGAERLPLTAAQTGMWFSQELDPGNPLYRAAEVVEIDGAIDVSLLEGALRQAVAETETLRVRFETDGQGRVRQVLRPSVDWKLPILDFRDAPDPATAAENWMCNDISSPAHLGESEPFSFTLLRTADEHFLVYLCLHHIVMDGYGFSLFIQRVAELYTTAEAGLVPPPCQFGSLAQLVADEADYRASERFTRDRDFWTEELADWPAQPRSARPWTAVPHSFIRETGYVAPSDADGLRALARRSRTSLPPVAMAALALYVHRLAGVGEVPLSLTVTGRVGSVARSVPAMLANVLPLRTRMSPSTTVAELVRHSTGQAKNLLRHQRYPSTELVRSLGVAHHASGYLEDWGINIMTHDAQLRFGRHEAVLRNLSNGPVTGIGVNVYDRPADGSLRIDFNADPAKYDADVTAAHHRRFLALLHTLATIDPERTIGSIDLLSERERHQVLDVWNGAPAPASAEKTTVDAQGSITPDSAIGATLPEHFQARVREAPAATALVCGDVELSAAEINARANRLAHLLISRGAGPETYVAVGLPRTTDYVVALLAVLKAGAACVPLEHSQPAQRLSTLLADVRPLCVLGSVRGGHRLPSEHPVLLLDDAGTRRELLVQPETDPTDRERVAPLEPWHAAYVSFTSGTTGRPKGVVVEHRQLGNLFHDHQRELINPAAALAGRRLRAALTASFSFDTAWEGPLFLAAGHELHLVDDETRLDASALVRYFARHEIDFADLTPSFLRLLLPAGLLDGERVFPWLLMIGGEAIDRTLWTTLRKHPGLRAYNYYGPTECTVDAVYCSLDEQGERPVIGRPGRNVRAYVLDAARQPVPPDVPGELYLGGDQVARGYLGQPELTAEHFVPDPFGPPGARLYRTGDLVRWTPQGVLDYLGRVDDQVKIRGVRIEPGEIETVLTAHPQVGQAVVTTRQNFSGEPGLVAYVVPAADQDGNTRPDEGDLRAWAAARLPTSMLPSAFVLLDEVPLTPNGKLDRKALEGARAQPQAGANRRGRPARSPRERQLCALFAEVLGSDDEVTVDDDFFGLGGHSVLAAELTARIRADLGTALSLGAIYEAPTVADLVRLLDEGASVDPFGMLLPLRADGDKPPLFCVHPAGGLSWCYAALPHHIPADVPVYGLQARGLTESDRLPDSFPEMIGDYVRHIRSVQPAGPYRLLGWSLGGTLAHAVATELQARGEQVELLVMLDTPPIEPVDRSEVVAGDVDVLPLLLEAAGLPPAQEGLPQSVRDHPALTQEHLAAITAVLAHSVELLPTFTARVFDGDLVYFDATQGGCAKVSGSDAWRSWVTGEVTAHAIDSTHHAMTQAEPMAVIGELLTRHLDRSERAAGTG
jgi:amino acid adenylation domain-containing protein